MQADGRIEKRARAKVPVHIVPVENELTGETTMTVNISRSGACVLANRPWHRGEQLALTSLSGGFQRQGRVIYCHPLSGRQFRVGVEFDASIKSRKVERWASVA